MELLHEFLKDIDISNEIVELMIQHEVEAKTLEGQGGKGLQEMRAKWSATKLKVIPRINNNYRKQIFCIFCSGASLSVDRESAHIMLV